MAVRIKIRCGNPYCGRNPHFGVTLGSAQRLADVSFFNGAIKCWRCKAINELVVIDGEVVSQTTTSLTGQIVYVMDQEFGAFDLVKPADKDTPDE